MAAAAAFYLGLALTAGATLALEILQVRILSVVSWYHLAFFVISIAMFGMTAGALFVFARPERFTPEAVPRRIARHALGAALAVPLAYLDQIVLAPEMVLSAAAPLAFLRLALSVSVPFFFSGVVVTLCLVRSGQPLARAYAADLLGASAGCLAVVGLLSTLDAAGAVFAIGAAFAVAAACFAYWSGEPPLRRPALAAAGLLALLAWAEAATLFGFDPILVKGRAEYRSGITHERWNTFSRVTARRQRPEPVATALWAPSRATPAGQAELVRMVIDGEALTSVSPMRGDPRNVAYLAYDASAVAYALRRGSVGVIGVGGGKDVMTALVHRNPSVLGVEINPAFLELLRGAYGDFTGLAKRPEVRLVNDEARSYLARSSERFDILQMSLVDTWAATGAGAFSLSENGLYTVEGWRIFLSRLTPTGIFTVSRWHAPENLDETARLLSLASATLFSLGIERPSDHLALAAHGRIATLIVGRAALSAEDLAALRAHCDRLGFRLALAPDVEPDAPWLRQIRAAATRAELEQIGRDAPLDLSPPTDDRPFFFNLLRLSRAWEIAPYLQVFGGVIVGNLVATLTLLALVLTSLVLAGLVLLLPGRFAAAGARPRFSGLAYFALIGAGFMFVEIAFLQRLSVFLGHPVYSLSLVLFSLILFTGLGSYLSPWLRLDHGRRLLLYGPALALLLAVSSLALPRLLPALEGEVLLVRGLVAVAVLAPAGLLMGQAFPAGMARFGTERDGAPWLWAVNGSAGVAASTAAVAVSIEWGIAATTLAGAACYASLPLTLRRRGV
jgi:SAM-dependent methyltransferase